MSHQRNAPKVYDLASLPTGSTLRSVTAVPTAIAGRRALRVELTDEVVRRGQPGIDYVDMPTFVILPVDLTNGTIAVDVLSRLNHTAPNYARGFAGIAYRITNGGDGFEAVYLRPLNGRKVSPPSPRDTRAIQYFSYPDWKFQRLRDEDPDGRYEAGADVGPDEWINLRIDVDEKQLKVTVDGQELLMLTETKATPVSGAIGLFVDIGTEAFFANLTVISR